MKRDPQIACLAAHAPAALSPDSLPPALALLRWGQNETVQGVFVVNERTRRAVDAQVAGGIRDRVVLDYEHNSEPFHPRYQPPPRKHAAAGVPVCSPEQGLGLADLAWTPSGREYALEYPDLSAAVDFDPATREVTGLRSAALCKQGAAVRGVAFFTAPEGETVTKGEPMEELLKKAQDMIAALEARVAALESSLGAAGKKAEDAETKAVAAMSAADQVKVDFAALSAERVKERKAALLDEAKRAGKVVPLNEASVAALSIDDLAATIASLKPGVVPLKSHTAPEGSAALSADTVLAQYNAITDPVERSRFFAENRKSLGL
jgi:phage I-like protein